MSGFNTTVPHPYRAACTGGPSAAWGGHRCMLPWSSNPRVRRAPPSRQTAVVSANHSRGYAQQFCIPTGPRELAVRGRNWGAIEVCGHKSPNHWYGVRPRRDKRVWWVQSNFGRPSNNSASLPGRVN